MDDSTAIGSNIAIRIRNQKVDKQARKSLSVFYQNLEEALDLRRKNYNLFTILQNIWQISDAVDFSSNDILSLGSSSLLRREFLNELEKNPSFSPGSGGSRVLDGNYPYLEETEQQIAEFHGAESGLLFASGFDANVAIWTAIPRLGDVIVYDALVHASTHEGMSQSLAMARKEFLHNDIESFRETLVSIAETQPLIKSRKRCIIVAVESVYSMDGDICPLQELVDIAREVFVGEEGTVQFVVDEAHSTGVIGENGKGLVSALGLERAIAVRLHTFGKAMSAGGAIILGNNTVRTVTINFARSVVFSTAPSFPFVAAIRAGYNLLASGQTEKVIFKAQDRVQQLVRMFLDAIVSHPHWGAAQDLGVIAIPLTVDTWQSQPYLSHIVPIRTQEPYHYWLFFHLIFKGFSVFPVDYPTVPKGQSRLKITFHAKNTMDEVSLLVKTIFEFVQEVVEIRNATKWGNEVPSAARSVYEWMEKEKLTGFGRM
ncbi:putative aminotransferase [Amniculicola lignicola CBS 123094]|uniref:Putative aminotransferase n=1 Tax=Amniculicola lignicola CBS 123094 TaxID=1392246 RepID=A0A6A5X1N7_9PLEO|nr:putative aminotransferase [Amniculicola lignicola CBS 123094]